MQKGVYLSLFTLKCINIEFMEIIYLIFLKYIQCFYIK